MGDAVRLVAPGFGGARVLRVGAVPGGARGVEELMGFLREGGLAGGEVLKAGDGRGSVFGLGYMGGGVVVKTRVVRGLRDRPAAWAGRTRLLREWRGGETARAVLGADGVVEHLVLWRGRDAGWGREVETLVMRRVDGPTALAAAAGRVPESGWELERGRRLLARRVGEQAGELARRGVFNRDHKGSNVVARGWPGDPRPVLIDPAGVRRVGERGGKAGLRRMLGKLVIECRGVGADPSVGLMRRAYGGAFEPWGGVGVMSRAAHRRCWESVARVVDRHGDATPSDDPLGGPAERATGERGRGDERGGVGPGSR